MIVLQYNEVQYSIANTMSRQHNYQLIQGMYNYNNQYNIQFIIIIYNSK